MISDKMLSEAAAELILALNASLPEPETCRHSFSPRFYRRMKRLQKKARHPVANSLIRGAANFLILLTLAAALLFALSPDVRAAVSSWIRHHVGYLTHYSYSGGSVSSQGSEDYYLSYTPEPYIEIGRISVNGKTDVHYKNEATDQLMHFSYSHNLHDMEHYLDTANYTLHCTAIRGIAIDFYESEDPASVNGIFWSDPSSGTFFWISAPEKLEVLLEIFMGIKIISN